MTTEEKFLHLHERDCGLSPPTLMACVAAPQHPSGMCARFRQTSSEECLEKDELLLLQLASFLLIFLRCSCIIIDCYCFSGCENRELLLQRETPSGQQPHHKELLLLHRESHGRTGDCVPGCGDHDPLQERPEVRNPGVWGHRFVCARAGREDFLLHIRAAVVHGCHLQEECGLQRHYQERRCSCSLLLTDCRPCLQLA
jgi:hypothetical protein